MVRASCQAGKPTFESMATETAALRTRRSVVNQDIADS